MSIETRVRLLIVVLLIAVHHATAVTASGTLALVVFDPLVWSIPPHVLVATERLRSEGHEIRLVESDVSNGDDQDVVELADCIAAAKRHGLPALVFRTGSRIAAGPVPDTEESYARAFK